MADSAVEEKAAEDSEAEGSEEAAGAGADSVVAGWAVVG